MSSKTQNLILLQRKTFHDMTWELTPRLKLQRPRIGVHHFKSVHRLFLSLPLNNIKLIENLCHSFKLASS